MGAINVTGFGNSANAIYDIPLTDRYVLSSVGSTVDGGYKYVLLHLDRDWERSFGACHYLTQLFAPEVLWHLVRLAIWQLTPTLPARRAKTKYGPGPSKFLLLTEGVLILQLFLLLVWQLRRSGLYKIPARTFKTKLAFCCCCCCCQVGLKQSHGVWLLVVAVCRIGSKMRVPACDP
jgi:hypothetical protein